MATTFKKENLRVVLPLSPIWKEEIAVNTADQKIYMRDESGGNTPANDQVVTVAGFSAVSASIDDAIVMAIA